MLGQNQIIPDLLIIVSLLVRKSSRRCFAGLLVMIVVSINAYGQSFATSKVSTVGNPAPGPGDLIIFQDDFESGDLSAWDDVDFERYSIETNPLRVRSGNKSLKGTISPENAYGNLEKWYMPGYDEVYVSMSIMFSEGFQNLRADGYGMHLLMLRGNRIDDQYSASGRAGTKPNGTDFFTTNVDPDQLYMDPTLRPFVFYTYYPDMECSSGGCWGNVFEQPFPQIDLLPDIWQDIVVYFKANTPGQYDGAQTLWINGVKAIDIKGMRWRDTVDLRQNQLSIVDYMESDGAGSPITEYVWMDNIMIWTPGSPWQNIVLQLIC